MRRPRQIQRLRLRLRAAAALLACGLAGCGAERAQPQALVPLKPEGRRAVAIPELALSFTAPANWGDLSGRQTRAAGIESRGATLAIWHYGRSEPLPQDAVALRRAQRALLTRVRTRDPSFRVTRVRTVRLGDAPAIEIVGRQTIAGQTLGVRSTHVFAAGAELVVDAHAPPEVFDRVDAEVFAPVTRTVRLGAASG